MENQYSSAPPLVSAYQPNLSIGHLFGKAFEIFKTNVGLVLGAFIAYALILTLPQMIGGDGAFGALLSLVTLIIGGPLVVGYYGLLLKIVRNESAEFSNLFDGFQKFGQSVGVYLLTALVVFVGFLLLIVPGVILSVGLWPVFLLVYDGSEGVVDTLKRAWDLTNGYKLPLFILFLVTGLFILAGIIALGVGIIITGAIGSIIYPLAYEELSLSKV